MAPKVPLHTRNADLAKYKKAGALSQQPSAADKLVRFILQLLLVTLWRSLKALSVPFGKVFAVYFWAGKSVVTLSLFVEKQLLKLVGWLSGTGFSRTDSRLGRASHYYFGMDVKRWHVGLVALLVGGMVTTIVTSIRKSFDAKVRQCMLLRQLMGLAKSYDEWRRLAEELEKIQRSQYPVKEDYDRKLLEEKTRLLRRTRATGNPREMMMVLRIDLIRNVANIAKSQKKHQNAVTIPEPVREYIKEVQEQLELLANWPEAELPLSEKLAYFNVTRHAYGRTALLLSGGGGLGTFHLGVCKALFERNLLPRVLAGSSVGSIVCAVLGCRTDPELKLMFDELKDFDIGLFGNSTPMDLMRHMVSKGHIQDIDFMVDKLKNMIGDVTFQEAFDKTGRILNITVCPADTNEPSRLLNYMTAPNVLVWSAVAASSSFPGLYPPQNLYGRNSKGEVITLHGKNGVDTMERRWRDGSLEFDLPVQTLSEMFNCNHFLVSQTNPHIVPMIIVKNLFPYNFANVLEAETKHRLQSMQWLLPEWMGTRYLTLFTQPWDGDITFALPWKLLDLSKTIINPTKDDLMRAVEVGERVAWTRLAAIQCNCTIEATLDKCTAKLKRKSGAQGMKSVAALGGRLPSWLHMPALPVPARQSKSIYWGDGIAEADGDAVASWGEYQNSPEIHSPNPRHSSYGNGVMGNGWSRHSASHLSSEALDLMNSTHLHSNGNAGSHTQLHPPTSGTVLAPIASSQSSDDGFDSASSVAAAAGTGPSVSVPPSTSGHYGPLGSLRRADLPPAGSAGMSRKSSVVRNLHALVHQDSDEPALVKGAHGTFNGHVSPPAAPSNRSSLSDSMERGPGSGSNSMRMSREVDPGLPKPRAHASDVWHATATPGSHGHTTGLVHSRLGLASALSLGPGSDTTSTGTPIPPPPVTIPQLQANGHSNSAPVMVKEASSPVAEDAHNGATLWGDLLPVAASCEFAEQKQRVPQPQHASHGGAAPEDDTAGSAVDVLAF